MARSAQPSARDLGAIAVGLAYRWADWVDRRDVVFEFVEDTTVRRTERIAFTLPPPERLAAPIDAGALIYVPLQILAKRTLLNSDIRDEAGARLTPLNTQRNGEVAGDGLVAMVGADLEAQELELTVEAAQQLHVLASSPSVMTDLEGVFGTDDDRSRLGWALKIGAEDESPQAQLIRDLSDGFLQLVQLVYEPGRHREITVAYDQRQEWRIDTEGAVQRILTALGGFPRLIEFPDLPIGRAQSTHVEVIAPAEMQLVAGSLQGDQYDTRDRADRERARRAVARRRLWRAAPSPEAREAAMLAPIDASDLRLDDGATPILVTARSTSRSRSRVHLHIRILAGREIPAHVPAPNDDPIAVRRSRAEVEQQRSDLQVLGRNDSGAVRVGVLPRRSGAIPAATLTTILTALALWVFAARLGDLDGQTSAAVLLLAPVVVGAYLSRPGEHAYTTRTLAWIRRAAVSSGLLALVLSGTIAAGALTSTTTPIRTIDRLTPGTADCVASVQAVVRRGHSARVPLRVRCPAARVTAIRVPGPRQEKVRPMAHLIAWVLALGSTAIAVLLSLSFVVGIVFDQDSSSEDDEPNDEAFGITDAAPTPTPSTVTA